MDITGLKSDLAKRAKEVAEHLLPNGMKQGNEWRVGSLAGEKGQSLGVHLQGAKAGVWSDFTTGECGDLIDLWVQVRSVSLSEALKQIADYLGVIRPRAAFQPKKEYIRPPRPKCVTPQGKVRDYLTEVRNIPASVLDAYKIGEQGDLIVFPFMLPDGELALVKVRKAEDGGKPKPTTANCEPVLFGWQAVPPQAREVVITEGEIDALSWAAYGRTAMSVPFGGGGGAKQQWIENDFERMERFEKIYIATDMDKGGDEAAVEIASRLGRHRCYRVMMPLKDANACLMDGVPRAAMDAAIGEAVSLDPEGLRKPTDFIDAVTKLFWPDEGTHVGYRTPYGKLGDKLLFRPGEVTLWTGASGAGKSQVLSDCVVDWVKQGSLICLSSLEMKASQTLKRMVKQVVGLDRPTDQAISDSLHWLRQGLLIYDKIGKAGVDAMLDVFDFSRKKYGCDQFIVDSLMRLGIASDDYVGQEKAMFAMVDWAVSSDVHLHVVAHARKGTAQGGAPETEDIKGASEIGANAFNIISMWRNRDLEEDIRKMEVQQMFDQAEKLKETPGVLFNVAKQRNGDYEGKIGLWFDQASYRYYSSHDKSFWRRQYIDPTSVKNGEKYANAPT